MDEFINRLEVAQGDELDELGWLVGIFRAAGNFDASDPCRTVLEPDVGFRERTRRQYNTRYEGVRLVEPEPFPYPPGAIREFATRLNVESNKLFEKYVSRPITRDLIFQMNCDFSRLLRELYRRNFPIDSQPRILEVSVSVPEYDPSTIVVEFPQWLRELIYGATKEDSSDV